MKRIFTFWEPKENIPGYLELCLASWKKYLPDYEIVILDYFNLENWLGKDFYPQVLYEKFSLPIQADAIRCALLNKYGGIWMDIDTIITSEKIKQYLTIDSELTLINNHIAFIIAKHIEGKILHNWQKRIFFNLKIAEIYYDTKTPQIIRKLLQKFFQKLITK